MYVLVEIFLKTSYNYYNDCNVKNIKHKRDIYMEQNDILSNNLVRSINKIEKLEAKLRKAKECAREEIKKQVSKQTFDELTEKIHEHGYSEEQVIVEEIEKKEKEKQKIEYEDYIAIIKIYSTISSNTTNTK